MKPPIPALLEKKAARWIKALRKAGCTWGRIRELVEEVEGPVFGHMNERVTGAEMCGWAAEVLGEDPSAEPWN